MHTDLERSCPGLEIVGHLFVFCELVAELVYEEPCAEEVVVHDHGGRRTSVRGKCVKSTSNLYAPRSTRQILVSLSA